jgi:hypothetical protein
MDILLAVMFAASPNLRFFEWSPLPKGHSDSSEKSIGGTFIEKLGDNGWNADPAAHRSKDEW